MAESRQGSREGWKTATNIQDQELPNAPLAEESVDGLRAIARRERAQYTTVGEMVLSVLRRAILTAALAPGEHLRQDSLASVLGVSRMPVRNALLQLEAEGLVSFHPHRGATVRALSPEQLREIYEIRVVLESYAVGRAIDEMTPERLVRLEGLAVELDAADSGHEFADRSFSFYRALYDDRAHPTLVDLIERLHAEVGRYWFGRRVIEAHESMHSALLESARRGDSHGAVRWLTEHLRRVAGELVQLVAAEQNADSNTKR